MDKIDRMAQAINLRSEEQERKHSAPLPSLKTKNGTFNFTPEDVHRMETFPYLRMDDTWDAKYIPFVANGWIHVLELFSDFSGMVFSDPASKVYDSGPFEKDDWSGTLPNIGDPDDE